jgi:hypothetical protein
VPADHERIRTATTAAWDRFHNAQKAYLQALIFVGRAVEIATSVEDLRKHHEDLGTSTAVLGLTQAQYFRANLFFSQISSLEIFLQDAVRAVIREYPEKVGGIQFKLSQLTEADSIEAIIDQAADSYLNELMYKKPAEYRKELCKTLSIEESPTDTGWPSRCRHTQPLGVQRDISAEVEGCWSCAERGNRRVLGAERQRVSLFCDGFARWTRKEDPRSAHGEVRLTLNSSGTPAASAEFKH